MTERIDEALSNIDAGILGRFQAALGGAGHDETTMSILLLNRALIARQEALERAVEEAETQRRKAAAIKAQFGVAPGD